ncbi:MAG: hypothetical protein JKX70_04295, partial [Phycisphaerales bacterium]|nr:hypothetical protein [Phycisphaerales bacterium]
DTGTLEDVIEPYLLQIGFLARTKRGRMITNRACKHLGLPGMAMDIASEMIEEKPPTKSIRGF